ncbi:MAG: hypothetical protein ACRDTF_12625 [Pseudonocardiaceae bacterium]
MNRRLRRAVFERLAAVEEMAVRTGAQPSARAGRYRLGTIAEGWRRVLIEHQPHLDGHCPACSGWLRRRHWPCPVWVTAHERLIGGAPKPTRWSAKKATKSDRFRHPRRVEVIPRQVCAPAAVEQPGNVEIPRVPVAGQEPTVPRSQRGRLSQT